MTNSPFDLSGRKILVTGASSGIGKACALAISRLNGTVIATGRDSARLQATFSALGSGGHIAVAADLSSEEGIETLLKNLSPLDGVVHCAGVDLNIAMKFVSRQKLREVFEINYEAPVLLTQRLLKNRLIQRGGSIVAIASTAALFGAPLIGVYGGSKAALIATMRSLALELAPSKIRVNCLAPAMVRTPMADRVEARVSLEAMKEHEKLYPLGFGEPEDVANAAVYFLSPASKWVTGSVFVMDGGHTCQ